MLLYGKGLYAAGLRTFRFCAFEGVISRRCKPYFCINANFTARALVGQPLHERGALFGEDNAKFYMQSRQKLTPNSALSMNIIAFLCAKNEFYTHLCCKEIHPVHPRFSPTVSAAKSAKLKDCTVKTVKFAFFTFACARVYIN